MADEPRKPDHISQEDWDAADLPELTDEDFANAKPFSEMFPEQYAAMKNKGGRPKLDQPTVKVGWRFPADLVSALRNTGRGYTDRIEAILRDALANGRL